MNNRENNLEGHRATPSDDSGSLSHQREVNHGPVRYHFPPAPPQGDNHRPSATHAVPPHPLSESADERRNDYIRRHGDNNYPPAIGAVGDPFLQRIPSHGAAAAATLAANNARCRLSRNISNNGNNYQVVSSSPRSRNRTSHGSELRSRGNGGPYIAPYGPPHGYAHDGLLQFLLFDSCASKIIKVDVQNNFEGNVVFVVLLFESSSEVCSVTEYFRLIRPVLHTFFDPIATTVSHERNIYRHTYRRKESLARDLNETDMLAATYYTRYNMSGRHNPIVKSIRNSVARRRKQITRAQHNSNQTRYQQPRNRNVPSRRPRSVQSHNSRRQN